MKQMKTWLIIFLPFILFSCNTEKAAQRQLHKIKTNHPQLFEVDTIYSIRKDTVVVNVPKHVFDTIVAATDTVVVEDNRFRTIIRYFKEEGEPKIQVQTEIKEVMIPVEVIDTVFTIKEKIQMETTAYIPKWFWLLFFVVLFLFIVSFLSWKRLAWHLENG
jgi:glycerol-3-phosphate dehydrogenase